MIKKYKKLDYNIDDLESLSNSDLKKVADYWLRQYLLKDNLRSDGMYRCPLKKQWYQKDKMHVAHFIDRGIINTRFCLINCHLVSAVSNTYDAQVQVEGYKSLHHKDYELYLIEEYGEETVEDLKRRGKELKMFTQKDYIEIIKKFRNA